MPAPAPEPAERLTSPCTDAPADEPPAPDSRVEKAALMAAMGRAQSAPDHAGLWVTGADASFESGGRLDVVPNTAFTGDLDRHERELREVWGGRLCVVRHEKTLAELRATQDELSRVVTPSAGPPTRAGATASPSGGAERGCPGRRGRS